MFQYPKGAVSSRLEHEFELSPKDSSALICTDLQRQCGGLGYAHWRAEDGHAYDLREQGSRT